MRWVLLFLVALLGGGRDRLIDGTTSSFSPKNLKTAPGQTMPELLKSWNDLKGLSEKELLPMFNTVTDVEREGRSLSLAYRRCEYVTQVRPSLPSAFPSLLCQHR